MKPLDLDNIEAIEQGDFAKLPAGGYVVKIDGVDDHEDKGYLWLVFDIAEGEHKGFYTKDGYYADKPNKHGIFVKYERLSEKAKGMLKGKLKVITESNPGTDAEAAMKAGKPELLVGKYVGLVAGMEEYVTQGDDGKWRKGESIDWFHARIKSPDDIRAGKFKVPATRELDDDDKAKLALSDAGASVSASVYDDVPFD